MNEDYKQLDVEMNAYHKGFEEGHGVGREDGRVFGMLEGIDFLLRFLALQKEAIIKEYTEGTTDKQEGQHDTRSEG